MKLESKHIDGILYFCIGVFTALQSYFTSDEAYKYCNPYVLFWAKAVLLAGASGAGSLKMYRSGSWTNGKSTTTAPEMPAIRSRMANAALSPSPEAAAMDAAGLKESKP